MPKLIIIRVDGSKEAREITKAPSLEQLQHIVGGYIERVPMFDTYREEECEVYCDEEGKIKGYMTNEVATRAWWGAMNVSGRDVLVGDVAILVGCRLP